MALIVGACQTLFKLLKRISKYSYFYLLRKTVILFLINLKLCSLHCIQAVHISIQIENSLFF